ncbi:MAG: hypothetical protein CVV27_16160 [Candidatus Melainabacteria bacterium HGW-Melainabacteria-1]|nr:MAG: hypothetical protein CVV27_16160 [Candidatus Melainabacteria bacterium HGW-Melainabacteria-1]
MIYTVDTFTNLILQHYDRNRDNHIQLNKGPEFEAERLLKQVQPGFNADTVTISWLSHEKLFKAADRNQDGVASRNELRDLIRFFDRDQNGQLEAGELTGFQQAFPVAQGLISSERVLRPGAGPDMGYNWYAVPRAIGRGSAGVKLPHSN